MKTPYVWKIISHLRSLVRTAQLNISRKIEFLKHFPPTFCSCNSFTSCKVKRLSPWSRPTLSHPSLSPIPHQWTLSVSKKLNTSVGIILYKTILFRNNTSISKPLPFFTLLQPRTKHYLQGTLNDKVEL